MQHLLVRYHPYLWIILLEFQGWCLGYMQHRNERPYLHPLIRVPKLENLNVDFLQHFVVPYHPYLWTILLEFQG